MNDIHKIIRDQIKEPLWDNWYIKDQIGSGASSVVYRIEARRENRIDVSALKIEPIVADEAIYVDEERRRDYLEKKRGEAENETTIMYKLRSSPNIVLYEDEQIKPLIHEGRKIGYYMLIRMEYLTCLQKLMKEHRFDCSEKNVMKLATDIGSGIKAAHDLGVIHRDIKPGNFFVSDSGIYKLGDFNISKKSVSARSFAGTEGYIAPEIYYARYGSDGYTKQADIYSFGIALYCLMNDYQFPFGDVCLPEEAIERRMNGEAIPPPKNASAGFARIILKACAFNTSERYQRMSDMLSDLKALENGSPAPINGTNAFAGTVPMNGGSNVYSSPAQAGYQAPVNNTVPPPAQNPYTQKPPAANIGYNTVYGQPAHRPQQYRKPPQQNEDESSGSGAKIFIISALVLILAVFGVILFFLIRENNNGGGSSGSSSSSSDRTTAAVLQTDETTTVTTTTTAETTTTAVTTRDTTIVLVQNSFDLEVGDTAAAIIDKYPEGSDANDEIWRSTDPSVATVDGYGFIKAVGSGKCYIIVTLSNNPAAEARVDINVKQEVLMPDFDGGAAYGASNILNGGYACTDGDKMFYSDAEKFYSVKDGRSTVIGNFGAHYMNFIGNDIFFCNSSADNSICSMKKDGSDFRVIYNKYCYELTYYDGWLYFSEVDNNTNYICRMKPDGSGYTKLRQVKCWYMSVYAGNIYYVNYDNNYSLDVMSVTGKDNTTLVDSQTSDLCISGGKLYYSYDRDSRWLYSMNPDGSGQALIRDEYTKHTNISGDNLFCTDKNNDLVVVSLKSYSGKSYPELGYISYPVIVGSALYTRGQNGETNIFSLD